MESKEATKRHAGAQSPVAEIETASQPSTPQQKDAAPLKTLAMTEIDLTMTFEDVRFRYNPIDPPALDGVSFIIPAGSRIAIVGSSGSGKSTIVNLLLRFWDCREGRITLAGRELRDHRADEVREVLGVVPQNVHLFNATLRDNLLLANPEATEEQIAEACRQAQLHDFIQSLPLKYDTLVGENGLLLSGGERQRLAIARAILKDAPILILDEATANLDAVTEQQLLQSLEAFMANRTVIIISHRPTVWSGVDQIVRLENGRIVGKEKHSERNAVESKDAAA
jgi:ABC-type multidrug transport system fused ATPase/permease subunit